MATTRCQYQVVPTPSLEADSDVIFCTYETAAGSFSLETSMVRARVYWHGYEKGCYGSYTV